MVLSTVKWTTIAVGALCLSWWAFESWKANDVKAQFRNVIIDVRPSPTACGTGALQVVVTNLNQRNLLGTVVLLIGRSSGTSEVEYVYPHLVSPEGPIPTGIPYMECITPNSEQLAGLEFDSLTWEAQPNSLLFDPAKPTPQDFIQAP